jgi:pimeloyl-ACP methyl ester carboxylesterase
MTQGSDFDPLAPIPVPALAPAAERVVDVPGATLWCLDTGGLGEPVVLLHPAASGDPRLWSYQQPVFAAAGYRVVVYARRGYYKSRATAAGSPGNAAEDLRNLISALRLGKVHVVSSGAGGSVAADHALSCQDQLLSLTISSNYAGVRGGHIYEAGQRARVPQWRELPRWFREFSASYAVANPEGLAAWVALQDEATRGTGLEQEAWNVIKAESFAALSVPTLLLTGDADSTAPPSLMRMLARHMPAAELVVVPEAGHSPYWERPDIFNDALLDFLRRHSGPPAAE